jgi:hypothetical protein
VAEKLDPRMVGVVPSRAGLEPLTADLEAVLLELAQHPLQPRPGLVVGHRLPDPCQPLPGRLVEAGSDPQPTSGDLDVPPGRRAGRDEGTLVGLVGRLVLGEPHVAVGAEDLGVAELGRQSLAHGRHRLPDRLGVDRLVLLPERAGVVDLEVVVEVEGSVGEPGERGHRCRV